MFKSKFKIKNKFRKSFFGLIVLTTIFIFSTSLIPLTTFATINKQINYQGKLTNNLNVAVTDGSYNVRFKLYTAASGGSPVWTETWCQGASCDGTGTDNRVAIANGLFSTMLGSLTSLVGVDFGQTLYLGVEVGGSGSAAVWDGEMTPRKVIGSVPSAFVADTLQGLTPSSFFRSDTTNSTSSASTYLSVTQTGAGKIAEFFGAGSNSALSILSSGNVGIGSTTPLSTLSVSGVAGTNPFSIASSTGNNLFQINSAGAAYFGNSAGTAGQFLQSAGTTGSPTWVGTSTLGLLGTATAAATYLPYTGGITNVNLGNYSLTASSITAATINGAPVTANFSGPNNSTVWTTSSGSYTNNTAVAPDLTTTAQTLTLSAGNNSNFDLFHSYTSLTAGLTYTVTAYVKLGTATNFALVVNNSLAWGTVGGCVFDTSTTIRSDTTGCAYAGGATSLSTSAWTQVSFTFTAPASNTINLHLGANAESGISTWPQTVGAVYLWGVQIYSSLPSALILQSISGNVGIGSTTPAARLGVVGNAYIAGNLTATGTLTVTGTATSTFGGPISSVSGNLILNSFGTTNNLALNPYGGKVGIGTSTPASSLSVSGTAGANPFVVSSSTGATLLSVLQNGNVGIGTLNPGAALELNGNILLSKGSGRLISVATSTSGVDGDGLTFSAGSTGGGNNNGGDMIFNGGNSTGTGVPGAIRFNGGNVSNGAGAHAGDIILTAGANSLGGTSAVRAGDVRILGGDASVGGGNVVGGSIYLTAGSSNTTTGGVLNGGAGGSMNLTLGAGSEATGNSPNGTAGTGGAFTLLGGAGGPILGFGTGGTGGVGSSLTFTSGAGGSVNTSSGTRIGGNSGNILIQTGAVGTGATSNGAAGTITFGIANAAKMTIDGSGNVGIGTTGPSFPLDVVSGSGDSTIRIKAHAGSAAQLYFASDDGSYTWQFLRGPGNHDWQVCLSGAFCKFSIEPTNGYAGFGGEDSPASTITSKGNLAVGSSYSQIAAPTNGVIIQGNVGIGTTTPTSKLTVTGTTTLSYILGATQCLHVNASGMISGTGSDCGSGGGGTNYWTLSGNDIVNNNTGSVVAAGDLNIGGNADVSGAITLHGTGTSVFDGGHLQVNDGPNDVTIMSLTGDTDNQSVYFFVGDPNDGQNFTLDAGSARADFNNVVVYANSGLDVDGTTFMRSLTSATGGQALCIDPTTKEVRQSGGTTCTLSSERFKHNINDLNVGLNEVLAMRPVSFQLNSDNSTHVGLIAEELNVIDPRLVFDDVDSTSTPRGIRYEELTAVLAKAIQDLNGKVDLLASSTVSANTISGNSSVLSSVTEWIGQKITAVYGFFTQITADKVKINKDIEMTDQDTGTVYCIVLKSGNFVKTQGACQDSSSTSSTSTVNVGDTVSSDSDSTSTATTTDASSTPGVDNSSDSVAPAISTSTTPDNSDTIVIDNSNQDASSSDASTTSATQ